MLGQRFGAKRVVLAGLVLMAIGGALMGLGSSFAMAAAGRIVSGTGAVLLTVLVSKMVTDWFAGREIVDRHVDCRSSVGRSASLSGL